MTMRKGLLLSIAAVLLSVPAASKNATPRTAAIPDDPLELVTGSIQSVTSPDDREAIQKLLARARSNYALRTDGPGYDLKVSFKVDSGGQTQYDGAWQMEEIYALAHPRGRMVDWGGSPQWD